MSPSSASLRVLWVTPRLLSGTPDGARHATMALVRHLARRNVSIDLVSLPMGAAPPVEEDRAAFGLHRAVAISRTPSIVSAPPSLFSPWTFRTFMTASVQSAFRSEYRRFLGSISPGEHAFVVFDGLHTAATLTEEDWKALDEKCQGLIYRAHNFETELWDQCIAKTPWPWMKAFFMIQTALVRRLERRLAERVSVVATVSEQDAEQFKRLAPGSTSSVVPIGMDFPATDQVATVPESQGLDILFIGRLDWLPNREGLKWFLDRVWKPVFDQRPGVTLTIAGMGISGWLDRYRKWPGVKFLGEVSRIEPLYQASSLAIAPLFQGSGTRVKIIEAARFARASMSTALGAQGGGLEAGTSYFRAETESEWVASLTKVTLQECREAGQRAFEVGRARFDAAAIGERFERLMRGWE